MSTSGTVKPAAPVVTITCPGCKTQQSASGSARVVKCGGCGKHIVFNECKRTGKTFPVLREWKTWSHPGCPPHPVIWEATRWTRWHARIMAGLTCLFILIWLAIGGVVIGYGVEHPYDYVPPDLNCNGSTMLPGDTCVTTTYVNGVPQGTTTETYDDRIRAADRASHNNGTTLIVLGSVLDGIVLCPLLVAPVLVYAKQRGGTPPRRPN